MIERNEYQVDTLSGFDKSLFDATVRGEALVRMWGVVPEEFKTRAMNRDGWGDDPKKALAEQYLDDIGRLGEFEVVVDRVEGSDLGHYWFVKNQP